MDCSTQGFPVHRCLPEFAQTHVHWVNDAIQPSHPLSPSSSPALNLSQHQGHFQWVGSSHQVAKYCASASASVLPMEIQGWFLSDHRQVHNPESDWAQTSPPEWKLQDKPIIRGWVSKCKCIHTTEPYIIIRKKKSTDTKWTSKCIVMWKDLGAEQCNVYGEDKEGICIYFHNTSDFAGNS